MAPDNPGSSTTSPASRLQIYRHSPSPAKPRADTARLVRDTVNELPKSTPKLLSAPSAPALRPAKPTPKPLSAKRSLRELQTAWIKTHAQTSPSTGTQKTRDMSQPAHHTFLPASPPPAISSAPSRGKGVEIPNGKSSASPQSLTPRKRSGGSSHVPVHGTQEVKRLRQDTALRPQLSSGRGVAPSSQAVPPAQLSTARVLHDPGVPTPPKAASPSRLSAARMPYTLVGVDDGIKSPQSESSSSSSASIASNRSSRSLDSRRPIRIQDSDSESGASNEEDFAPDSRSPPPAGRPLRQRVSLPVYNLKQLSGRPMRKRTADRRKDQDGSEGAEATDNIDIPAADMVDVEYDEMKPIKSCGDRLYSEWIGIYEGKATKAAGAGALFPKGYAPLPGQKLPWVCPVRNCRKLFSAAWALGGHFNMSHRAALLNDNGDGTMTVLGKREHPEATGRFPAIVVSAVLRLGDRAAPLAEPRPAKVQGNRTTSGHGSHAAQEAPSPLEAGANSKLWRHLLEMLPTTVRPPNYPAILGLLTLPQRRPVPSSVKDDLTGGKMDVQVDIRALCALLIYLTGSGGICNHCGDEKRGNKMFDTCIALHPSASPFLKKHFGASICCNCYLDQPSPPCVMVRSSLEASGLTTDMAKSPDNPDDSESPLESGEESTSNPTGATPVPVPTYAKKASHIPSTHVAPPSRKRSVKDLADSLELEEWELAPGRVRDETAHKPENIAFSTAFLSQNQTVTIGQDITFRVQMVNPGSSVRLAAETDRLRICSVASGKVRVKVAGQNFAVGPNGVWKVKSGDVCMVTNRYYLDAVVHISCVPYPN